VPTTESEYECTENLENKSECPSDAIVCDSNTVDNNSVLCLNNDGSQCCKVGNETPVWGACPTTGKCAYAKRTAIVTECGSKKVIEQEEFCKTGMSPCTCTSDEDDNYEPTHYKCTIVENAPCVPDKEQGLYVVEQCKILDKFKGLGPAECNIFEVVERCEVKECSESITSNCCEARQCVHDNDQPCEQPIRKCYDTHGNEMPSETSMQDCCDGLPVCTEEQVRDICSACDSTFPNCLDDPDNLICTDGNIKCTHDPSSCQCGDFECGADSFSLPVITNDVLNQMHLDLPDVLYSSKLRFFLGQDGTNWNDSNCYHMFDRNDADVELKVKYAYSDAKLCDATEIKRNEKSIFQISIMVDGYKVNHMTLGTHTQFAQVTSFSYLRKF